MIERIITARALELGGVTVGRVLPVAAQRAVGPFVFLDHMGPAVLAPMGGFDVRPHPHVGLATLTYLYEGEQMHRDSMGVVQEVRPLDANMMIAGRGVVHSERATERVKRDGGPVHGLQFWLALPRANEDDAPSFQHRDAAELPRVTLRGVEARIVLGSFMEKSSPLSFPSPALLLDVELAAGAMLSLSELAPELAVYAAHGELTLDGTVLGPRQLAVVRGATEVRAAAACRIALFGGAPLDGPRHMFWNFVASDTERLERAKADWRERRFPSIPGDDVEFIPLP